MFFYLTRGLVNNINISNMAAIILLQIKKMTLGQVVTNFTGQVVASFARTRAGVCVCYNTIVVYSIHLQKICNCMFILKENV